MIQVTSTFRAKYLSGKQHHIVEIVSRNLTCSRHMPSIRIFQQQVKTAMSCVELKVFPELSFIFLSVDGACTVKSKMY